MIVAAGLLATTCTLQSCKKESVKTTTTTTSKSGNSNARLLTTSEVNDLITEVNNFLPYAESVAVNPSAQSPNTLPYTLADADVVRYLENGLNFTYALQEDKLKNHLQDEFSITIPKNNDNTNINDVANSFVTAYNHIKTVYNNISCANDEKILRVVDVEVTSTSSSTLTIKLRSVFKWGYDPTLPVPGATSITIPSLEWANWASMSGNSLYGGPLSPYSCGGGGGAPEIIHGFIETNWGKFLWSPVTPSSGKTKFHWYLVSNVVSFKFDATPTGGCNIPILFGNNPWIVSQWGTSHVGMPSSIRDNNSLAFYKATDKEGFAMKIYGDGLNYMIDGSTWVLKQKEIALNKSLWTFYHTTDYDTKLPYTHVENYVMTTTFGDVYDWYHMPATITPYSPSGSGGLATF